MQWDPYTNTKQRDWSVVFLWSSLCISAFIISGTLVWNLGRALRISQYLQEHGVTTCVNLHRHPGQQTPKNDKLRTQCETFVESHHDQCLHESGRTTQRLSRRQHEYVTCIMAVPSAGATLTRAKP